MKKTRPSFMAEARKGKPLYAFAIEPKKLKSVRWDKMPASANVVIVSVGDNPELGMPKTLGKSLGRFQFVAAGTKTQKAKPAAPAIQEGAFQPGARARALLRGAEIVEQDLRASGGAFGLEDVCKLMHGVTRQAIHKRVSEGSLLAVRGPSNRNVYPVVQFATDGTPVEGLKEVREALGTRNPWMLLNFLVNAEHRLGDKKPIDLLKAGKLDAVLEAARRVGVQGA
jgi:hypothetical protein